MSNPELSHNFSTEFPELAIASEAEEALDPRLVILNEDLASDLGLDPDWLRTDEGIRFLLGADGGHAMAYSGHQFGQLSPQLGDGRALLLGELKGRDVHLKGSGPTLFSRGGDGRGAIGPMLREYLMSEAMHALGVPTTRALAVLTTGRRIQRSHFVPAAVLVRVAASHIRIGTFQYTRLRDPGTDLIKRLADHATSRHYPEASTYVDFFAGVMDAQAALVSRWMRLGFIHGVMNTDNTTISGETIDYGPCAFLEEFNPSTVFSSIDTQGRYAYQNQPAIIGWNLARFAETLLPLIDEDVEKAAAKIQPIMNSFQDRYRAAWLQEMSQALGLIDAPADLLDDLVSLLTEHQPDLTSFNRMLADISSIEDAPSFAVEWVKRWLAHEPNQARMQEINPVYIPRNHLVEEALRAAEDGDTTAFHQLLQVVTSPFERREGLEHYERPAPDEFGDYITYCGT